MWTWEWAVPKWMATSNGWSVPVFPSRWTHSGRFDIRSPKWLTRRCKFNRHYRVDARTAAAIGSCLGSFLQFYRIHVLRIACGQNRGNRDHSGRSHKCRGDFRRAHGGDLLEPDYVVGRYSLEQLARTHRRPCGCRYRLSPRLVPEQSSGGGSVSRPPLSCSRLSLAF